MRLHLKQSTGREQILSWISLSACFWNFVQTHIQCSYRLFMMLCISWAILRDFILVSLNSGRIIRHQIRFLFHLWTLWIVWSTLRDCAGNHYWILSWFLGFISGPCSEIKILFVGFTGPVDNPADDPVGFWDHEVLQDPFLWNWQFQVDKQWK